MAAAGRTSCCCGEPAVDVLEGTLDVRGCIVWVAAAAAGRDGGAEEVWAAGGGRGHTGRWGRWGRATCCRHGGAWLRKVSGWCEVACIRINSSGPRLRRSKGRGSDARNNLAQHIAAHARWAGNVAAATTFELACLIP